ncbi:mediator of RNA polymerase II transcription subunit 15-like isoform X2 [Actinia tenebrosa]|uniref:Mediator of RNA polymerase II transcription subunit 15 n=1 Tax=Actinia tenebrosa TaxID=6105 RepID=A0A6P8J3M7_ACTTE|nr:mediator of RNA polymerase II transcription subunit 15-like isoform X2 [Actinia tenebrosa]
MANSETEDWRSPHFRQKVTSQIDDALRKSGNPQMMTRNAADIERDVFSKAKSRDEYMCYVARVLVFARDVGPGRGQPGRPGPQPGQPGQNMPQMVPKVQMQTVNQVSGMRPMYTPQISTAPMTSVSNASYQPHQMTFRNENNMASTKLIYSMMGQQQQQQQPMNAQTMAQLTQAMQQHQQYTSNLPNQQQMQVTSQPVQQQPVHGHPATVSAMNQSHPSPQMVSSQHGQQSHAVSSTVSQMQARMQTVPSPAMRTPASHPSPATSQPIIPSPAYQPTPSPAPGIQHGMTPSPQQHMIPQSPATSSVPTPVTLNVQSPASILNPASVGPPAASPAPLSAAEEQAYLEKHKQLSVYIEPLNRMINKMNRDQEHSTNDLKKLKNFLDILTNPSKRLSLAVLEKCEQVLKKMNLKPPQRTTTQTASPTTATQSTAVAKASAAALTASNKAFPSSEDHPQISGQALFETVVKHLKSPLFSHTLKRTFSPVVQSMEGPPICPPPPPTKKIRLTQVTQKKCSLPHTLQGELARLCDRFTIKPEIYTGNSQRSTLLRCSIHDEFLPAVPPIEISVPQNYPHSSPGCNANAYETTPFLLKIRSQLLSELRRMPGFYSVTSLLGAWEASIRLACMSEVEVK